MIREAASLIRADWRTFAGMVLELLTPRQEIRA